MNVGQLKRVIAAYLNPSPETGNPVDRFSIGPPGPSQVDLLLQALNNVRKEAEQLRDFELSKVVADVAIDAYSGALLSDAKLHGTTTTVSIKAIRDAGIRWPGGALTSVNFKSLEGYLTHQRTVGDAAVDDFDARYPGDPPSPETHRDHLVLQQGNRLYVTPAATQAGTIFNVELSISQWLPAYTLDANTDFFTEHCHNYLMWAGICEANHLTQRFVFRQEGNLQSPKDFAEKAWLAVEKWDDFIIESGRVLTLD